MKISIFTNTGDHMPNEDYTDFVEINGVFCMIVADGLGGHGCGEVASKTAALGAFDAFSDKPEVTKECIGRCFTGAYQALNHKMGEKHEYIDMKSTLSIFITDEKKYVYGYIGDTRIYCFNKNKVIVQSLDHSVPQTLVAAGKIKPKQIRYHQDRNKLLRVMDTRNEPRFDVSDVKRLPYNIKGVLLCTDGFWEHIVEKRMVKLLNDAVDSDEWIVSMAEEVDKNGNIDAKGRMDNYTCLGVKF